jgi:hypothetical protein
MISDLQIINPLDYKNWDELLLNSQRPSFFQSTAWLRVLTESYKYKICYFTIINNNQLKVLIPMMEANTFGMHKRGVSLPFSDYCPIIIDPGYNFNIIQKEIQNYGKSKGWKYLEYRDDKYFNDNDTPSVSFYQHSLQLENDTDKLFNKFNSVTRRNIKKALRENIKIEIGYKPEMIRNYYFLHCATRKKHGIPPQPFYFFNNIYKHIIEKKMGTIFLVSLNNLYIAGMVFFHFAKEAIYKYGASIERYQSLRPNNLVMWEAIKFYTEQGYNMINFGRTDIHHEGLRHFKNGWNTTEIVHHYYKFSLTSNTFVQDNGLNNKLVFKKVMQILPASMLKIIGKLTYKYIG